MATLARTLTQIFTEKTLVELRCPAAPYHPLAPGVQLGFEPSARVEVETRPKVDFTRSPDQCLDTLIVDYRAPSRWLTIEAEFDWSELVDATRFQIGVYGRTDRATSCRGVLRLPRGADDGDDFEDVTLCELGLASDGRPAHAQGRLGVAASDAAHQSRRPRLLFFFDPSSDLRLELDYVTAYFA